MGNLGQAPKPTLSDNVPDTSDSPISDERVAITLRMIDLMELVITDLEGTLSTEEVVETLRRTGRHNEAEELEMLIARAEELGPASLGCAEV